MAASTASPRARSIRETVLESVAAYHHQQRMRRRFRKSLSYAGELSAAGRAVSSPSASAASFAAGPDDDDAEPFWEEEEGTVELVQLGANRAKNVLILMSDTGGGHRASAEAIKDAFRIEFGDDYRVFVKDLCKDHAGWPLNNMENSYKFMVKHVQLWKVAFHGTSPRWVHNFYLAALASFYAKKVEAGLKKYKPDIIISVHPLMQHIPLWVLKWQGLQNRVVFTTVITDLNTCHPTWFHSLKVSPRYFPALVDVGSIKELNWCKFVVQQLENCISSPYDKKNVGGCLFYLLILYLDSLDIQSLRIPDGTPRVCAWDQKLLNKVIMMDRKNRTCFGKCFFKMEEATRIIKSRGTSVLLGDVSAIANFVSANVRPEYTQQNKEVLCKATGNLCASITDALAKFMREVSGLEGCSTEAGKGSTEVTVREDNNAKNDGDQMDIDTLPDDSSELESKDMEDTSVDEYEDGSSEEGEADDLSSADSQEGEADDSSSADSEEGEADDSSSTDSEEGEADGSRSTDSEDDPDWEDFSRSITRFHSQQSRVTRNSDSSKEPGDGDVTANGSGNVTTNGSGNDSDIPEGNLGRVNRCSEEQGSVAKKISPSVHKNVALTSSAMSQGSGKAGDVTTNGAENDLGIQEGDQGRVKRCSNERAGVHEDAVVPSSAVSQLKSRKLSTKKRNFLEDTTVIQPTSLLYGESSMLALHDDGNSSKEGKTMEKAPVVDSLEGTPFIDLSTPTNSDSECNGSKRSS